MTRTRRLGARHRRHGAALAPDRRELEAAGWRTTLDYRENHVRARDGRLRQLHVVWHAVAERDRPADDRPNVVSASASSVEMVWSRLRAKADLAALEGRPSRPRAPVDVA